MSPAEKMNVCQKCGDRGQVKRLVSCKNCLVSAEHSYCMDNLPRRGEKNIIWMCEECCPREAKPTPVPSRRSERIQGAAENKLRRVKSRKQTTLAPAKIEGFIDRLSQAKPQPKEVKKVIEPQPKPRRRLVIEDDEGSDEEYESSVAEPSQSTHAIAADSLDMSNNFPLLRSNSYIHAKPIIAPIWKGSFTVQDVGNQASVELMAHISTKACSKVWEAANALPLQLNTELLSRSDAWPQKFQITPPTDENIGLYFFPQSERDEKVFDSLMEELIIHDRALKAVINDLEMLVFSSRQLPQEHWRFRRKYYMWGVFKPSKLRADSFMPSNPPTILKFQCPHQIGACDKLLRTVDQLSDCSNELRGCENTISEA